MNETFKALSNYKKELESMGYNVIYISLYGSQNYNLHDDNSDIDARAVVLLDIADLIKGRTVSKTYDFEQGQVDVKDVVGYVNQLAKGNPAYTETAQTEYYIGDKEFRTMIEEYEFSPRAAIGMMYEKKKAIEKYLPNSLGMSLDEYDPKQFHHILRLRNLLADGKCKYEDGKEKDEMMSLKRSQTMTRDKALRESDKLIDEVEALEIDYESKGVGDELYEWLESRYSTEKEFKIEPVIVSLEQHRTFGGDLPKNVKRTLSDEQLEYLNGKDVGIVSTYEIEVYE